MPMPTSCWAVGPLGRWALFKENIETLEKANIIIQLPLNQSKNQREPMLGYQLF